MRGFDVLAAIGLALAVLTSNGCKEFFEENVEQNIREQMEIRPPRPDDIVRGKDNSLALVTKVRPATVRYGKAFILKGNPNAVDLPMTREALIRNIIDIIPKGSESYLEAKEEWEKQ